MKSKIVPVKNITRLATAQRALLTRAPGTPGIGVVQGPAGYGKTKAVTWLHSQLDNSVNVRAMAVWTPSAMLSALCRELHIQAGGSCASQVERIVERLSMQPAPVWIDEVHYIIRSTRLIETLRDIHDMSNVPVILVGEERTVEQLSGLRRLTSRIAQEVEFEPLDEEDTQLVADELCDVEVRPDLLAKVHDDTRGNTRNIVVALGRIEQHAKARGMQSIGLNDWGNRKQLFTGEASPIRAVK